MHPKTHKVGDICYVVTPYREGTHVRDEVFWRQFSITCQGLMVYPEEDPNCGTWSTAHTLRLGWHGLIERAMSLANARVLEHEFDLGPETDACGFEPELVVIRDSLNRLVLTGRACGNAITWSVPVTSDEEAATVAKDARRLRDEASYEASWDNFATADGLRLQARVLEGRLVDQYWRRHASRAVHSMAAVP